MTKDEALSKLLLIAENIREESARYCKIRESEGCIYGAAWYFGMMGLIEEIYEVR